MAQTRIKNKGIVSAALDLSSLSATAYGTSGANKLLQLDGTGKIPAVDGSQIMGVASVPAGTVIHVIIPVAPTGYLKANGSTIGNASSGGTARANADTAALFALLWDNITNANLPIQDSTGAASTRGANAAADFAANKRMPLPDLRGEFLRGFDDGKGTDSGRALGSTQLDDFKGHTHGISTSTTPGGDQNGLSLAQGGGVLQRAQTTGGTETRPRNLALLACIKY